MWDYLRRYNNATGNFSAELIDPNKGTKYQLCMSETMQGPAKFSRGGLPKPLGTVESGIEGWITLGSFCDLLNNYVLLKDQNNNPLTQITTYETNTRGNRIGDSSLKCIASPLSISTNLGVCLVRNDNWASLGVKKEEEEKVADNQATPTPLTTSVKEDIRIAFDNEDFSNIKKFKLKTTIASDGKSAYYNGDLEKDIIDFANELQSSIVDIIVTDNKIRLILPGNENQNNNFILKSQNSLTLTSLNWFDYFYPSELLVIPIPIPIPGVPGSIRLDIGENTLNERVNAAFEDLFFNIFAITGVGINDNTNKSYTKKEIIPLLKKYLGTASIDPKIQDLIKTKTPEVAQNVAAEAVDTLITKNTLQFLVPGTSLKTKTLGNISNIYVNINYLYSQAISKNGIST